MREIERALGAPGPLPDDVRRDLWDFVRLLNNLVEETGLTPKQAAALIPKVLGLTGRAIGAYREERRKESYGWAFELAKEEGIVKRGEVDSWAAELAQGAKVTTRQIYRWGEWFRARKN